MDSNISRNIELRLLILVLSDHPLLQIQGRSANFKGISDFFGAKSVTDLRGQPNDWLASSHGAAMNRLSGFATRSQLERLNLFWELLDRYEDFFGHAAAR